MIELREQLGAGGLNALSEWINTIKEEKTNTMAVTTHSDLEKNIG